MRASTWPDEPPVKWTNNILSIYPERPRHDILATHDGADVKWQISRKMTSSTHGSSHLLKANSRNLCPVMEPTA